METIYKRWQEASINKAIKTRRVILLSGIRQSGKTTLTRSLLANNTIYRTLDDVALLDAARNDPKTFVERNGQMMLIDEVQRVPELLLAIKQAVDQDNQPGQYLLTGSSNIQSLSHAKDSLAGRIKNVRLRTLTVGEILGKQPNFLHSAFNNSFPNTRVQHSQKEILELALRGGFPELIALEKKEHRAWHRDYIDSIMNRDLQDLASIRNITSMRDLISVLASWSSKFMDVSAIGSKLAITRVTIENYISALEMLYVVEKVLPWVKTDYARVGKQAKVFITDSGLMASILGYDVDNVSLNQDRLGKIFETFVFNELAAQVDVDKNSSFGLFHYRDRDKREIDFIIERDDGAMLGIEVKASAVVYAKHFKHLQWFAKTMTKDKPFVGIVLYSGQEVIPFGKNMWAVPISFLWA